MTTTSALDHTDTNTPCPGCGQMITVVHPDAGVFYSECGGEGEGGCDVWIGGDRLCELTHQMTIITVKTYVYSRENGLTSCVCADVPGEDRVTQPVGECPCHGDEETATRMFYTELEEGEEWASHI